MVIGGVANERAAKLQALHNAAEARGYNGAQVVAELTRVVVEQGRDWDRAYQQALSFYAPPVVAGEVAADRVAAIGVMLAGWYRRVAVAADRGRRGVGQGVRAARRTPPSASSSVEAAARSAGQGASAPSAGSEVGPELGERRPGSGQITPLGRGPIPQLSEVVRLACTRGGKISALIPTAPAAL